MISFEEGALVGADEYRALRAAVGWAGVAVEDDALQDALDWTWNVAAHDEAGTLVGFGRLLDDGAVYATIWDMLVLPERQRQGIGTEILERLLARAAGRSIVALVATEAGRGLYERYGFGVESGGSVGMLRREAG